MRKILQLLFNISILIKFVDGLIEFAGGIAFIFLNKSAILDMLARVLQYNLLKIDSEEVLRIVQLVSDAMTTRVNIFIAAILVSNGLIKIILAPSLYLKKLYAFPVALWFLVLLLIYQVIETFYTPSMILWLLNAFEVGVILVIWLQYRQLQKEARKRKRH